MGAGREWVIGWRLERRMSMVFDCWVVVLWKWKGFGGFVY